jgi:glycosyltransferase involved in cell wall biosynthesis
MRVGVIVPVRAPAPHLDQALDSVLDQEPAPDAVVVVDDRSDPPLRLSERHAGRCRQVRGDGEPGGPAAARALGLSQIDADAVALADADDVWEPGKLAAQLAAFDRHPQAAVCFGRAEVVGPDGRPTGERWEQPGAGLLGPEHLAPILFDRNPIPAASALIRRTALDDVGGFLGSRTSAALSAGTDWELWLRLVDAGHSFVCEPQARIRYRRHAGGVTADVARLGQAALAIHEAYGHLVDEPARRRTRARDLTVLARGRIRERRYAEAREALREAAGLAPPERRERLLRALAGVPLLRSALGRRDPYHGSTPAR